VTRRGLPVLLLVAGLGLTACGGGAAQSGRRAPVRLTLSEPADQATVHTESVELHGDVKPRGASVEVRGTKAPVRAGAFSASVPLEPGVNVIDVLASAPGARPALTAIRVRRQVVVTVPDLAGASPSDAASRLDDIGLSGKAHYTGGLFDDLVPDDPVVCATDPKAGERAKVGSTVTLLTARLC
jgi:hypothetical protein